MSDLVPEYSKHNNVIQPQLSRVHHAFRGPMNSGLMNLQAEQIRYDLTMLRSKLEGFSTLLEERLEDLVEGGDFAALTLDTLDSIYQKIQEFETRIKRLQTKEGL